MQQSEIMEIDPILAAFDGVRLQPLTAQAFAPFGDVISCDGADFFPINQGHTERYHALSLLSAEGEGAQIGISIFRNVRAHQLPFSIGMLERHPFGSQSFMPLSNQVFIIIVALPKDEHRADEAQIKAFISNGKQGVTYHQGVWHHPLISLEAPSDFLVVDRIGGCVNCDVQQLATPCLIEA